MTSKVAATKKRMIISYLNLNTELLELFNERYPVDYGSAMTRIDKPNGDFFHVVPLETDEISYMVKVEVKIDKKPEDELEKDFYSDSDAELAEAEQIADMPSEESDD